jgi:hypothetical protein
MNEIKKKIKRTTQVMNRCSKVHDIVSRLTDDPTLRTFFTLYLMAGSDKERQKLSDRFWKDTETLDEAEQLSLKDAFNRSFKQVLPLVNQLYDKVVAAQAKEAVWA